MEKEILEMFEEARKAGEAVVANGGSPEVDRCIDALKQLKKIPMTTKGLVATQVGKRILSLTKHPHQRIQTVASDLRQYWKDLVIQETTNSSRKNIISENKASARVEVQSERSEPGKIENVQKPESMKIDKLSRLESLKVEKVKIDKVLTSETVKAEKSVNGGGGGGGTLSGSVKAEKSVNGGGGGSLKVETTTEEVKKSSVLKKELSTLPPKLTSMIKCNDEMRDKFREILFNALSKVFSEASEDMMDEVAACDPIRVAVSVESTMFEKLGRSNGAQKTRYRSIMFNMRDEKNPDFRRRVLLGEIRPAELITITIEEMASDERKRQNDQIKEKALLECERAGAPKATTDQFRCSRCGQRKTTYHQMQTRSADEPMTTFVTCVNCGKHWKFC